MRRMVPKLNLVNTDFERMQLLFKRAGAVPDLPGSAVKLITLIDSGDASAIDLERIVAADSGLCACILRVANSDVMSGSKPVSTIRNAIMRLGQKTVRSMALSIMVSDSISNRLELLDSRRLSQHTLFAAFLARYTYARRQRKQAFETEWSADEVFAATLFKDISIGLLARLDPDAFGRTKAFAQRTHCTLNCAFQKLYGSAIGELGAQAVRLWKLPDVFVECVANADQPWRNEREYISLCCISYGNYLACMHGASIEEWPVQPDLSPEVTLEVGLEDAELCSVLELVEQQVDSWMGQVAA